MKRKIILTVLISILTISSCFSIGSLSKANNKLDGPKNPSSNANWTIMVYLDGDNDLEYFAIDDFLEMAQAGSNNNVNIIVQFDRSPYYDTRYGDWTSTKRFRVTPGMVPDSASAISDIGEANMGNPQTVINFANWAKTNYPANRYCLIFWDHGSGWRGDETPRKFVCYDETNQDALQVEEIGSALSVITSNGANKIGLIGFDACLMQMTEVGYEISSYGEYMTGSEETEPGTGWDYDTAIAALKDNPTMAPKDLGAKFVYYYSGNQITLSTTNIGIYPNLRLVIDDLAIVLKNTIYKTAIGNALSDVEKYDDSDFIDLYNFAQIIEETISNNDVKNKALAVMYQVGNVVTSEKHDSSHQNSHGLSIYFPTYDYNSDYDYLLFAQDSQWDELLRWYHNGGVNPPSKPYITGPYDGKYEVEYNFTFTSTDPNGKDLNYYVEWGDNSEGELSDVFMSGETWGTTHTYYSAGAFIIKAKSINVDGAESEWSTFTITMPRNRQRDTLLHLFDHFPILKLIFRNIEIYQFLK